MLKKMLCTTVSLVIFAAMSFGQENTNQKEPPPQRDSLGRVSWEILESLSSQKKMETKTGAQASYTVFPIHMQIEGLPPSGEEVKEISPAMPRRTGEAFQQSPLDTVIFEGFEGTFPSSSWRVFDGDSTTNGEYFWAKRTYRKHTGAYSAWCVGGGANGSGLSNGSNYPSNAKSYMIYGPFDLSGTNWAAVTFYLRLNTESNYDFFSFTASVNGTNFYGYKVSGSTGGSGLVSHSR